VPSRRSSEISKSSRNFPSTSTSSQAVEISGAGQMKSGEIKKSLLFSRGRQLVGSIPPELGKLAALQDLDLSRNQLT
ncbi:unnamed protein product, partial [Ectocarpus sp. 12 AP-2014]